MNPNTASAESALYVGRFAPSPTGPLHAGSLVAALASYLDARHHSGRWLLRIDDIDPPRAVAGADRDIQSCLASHGMEHDAEVIYQSRHTGRYEQALSALAAMGLLFQCTCTRRTLAPGGVCVDECHAREAHSDQVSSLRVHVPQGTVIEFEDAVLGPQTIDLAAEQPNFIVRRRDGLYAYQLAAAVDDGSGISHVIRGRDLLPSTFRQLYLQQCLALESPIYGHTPILSDSDGNKLSKQTGAPGVDIRHAEHNIRTALHALGQESPPPALTRIAELLDWATMHWQRQCVPR